MTTIGFDNTVLATGLFWHSGAKNNKQARQRALDLVKPTAGAKGAGGDFLCVRSTSPVQFGISNIKDGHQPGMTAAAAALADALPGSWAGVFAVAEGWYFVQTGLGFVAPRGDRLYRPEERDLALDALVKAKKVVDSIYAPKTFSIENAEERLIDEIIDLPGKFALLPPNRLRPLRAPTTLRQLRITRKQLLIGLAAALAGTGTAAVTILYNRAPPPPGIEPVWETARAPADMAQTCTHTLLAYPAVAGYRLQKAACSARSVTFSYKGWGREYRYLSADAPAPAGCGQQFADSGELTVTCAMSFGQALGRQMLTRGDDAKRLIYKHLAGLGLDVRIIPATEQQTPQPGQTVPPITVPILKIDVDGKYVPEILSADLAAMPGMTIDSITFTPPAQWHLQGKLYYVR